jgi:hypothetical protein
MLGAMFSFFTLVATSMYTANLATQLLLTAQEKTQVASTHSVCLDQTADAMLPLLRQYTDLEDVIADGKKVCVRLDYLTGCV